MCRDLLGVAINAIDQPRGVSSQQIPGVPCRKCMERGGVGRGTQSRQLGGHGYPRWVALHGVVPDAVQARSSSRRDAWSDGDGLVTHDDRCVGDVIGKLWVIRGG